MNEIFSQQFAKIPSRSGEPGGHLATRGRKGGADAGRKAGRLKGNEKNGGHRWVLTVGESVSPNGSPTKLNLG